MTQSQSQILLITFSHQLLRLFSQKSNFKTNSFKSFFLTKNNDFFIITATNIEKIYKIISSLNINKTCEPNSISSNISRLAQDQISKYLATICSLSFSTGIFPTIFKAAEVIPIHVKDSKLEVSKDLFLCYLILIKMFEKLMHSRLIDFFEERQILYYKQFGFQKETKHAILIC